MSPAFRDRLAAAVARCGPLCVGIDPHPELLAAWGLEPDAAGVERFARTVVESLAGEVALLKPQVALFEALGSAGIAALETTLADARDAGLLTLADAKRGDIGSTMEGYARAWLAEGSPLAADAVTLSPYLGVAALAPALDLAARTGRGVFVLARTSNREARELQGAQLWSTLPSGAAGMREVAQLVVDAVAGYDTGPTAGAGGVVVGLTRPSVGRGHGLDLSRFDGPVLVPGLGAQGGTAADVRSAFAGPDAPRGPVVPVSAREVLAAGPGPGALRATAKALNGALTG